MTEPLEPAIESDVEDFAAGQRRRKLIAAIVAAVVIAAVAIVVAIRQANKLPSLDPDEVKKIGEALDQIPAEYRQEVAAAALVELEVGRIPLKLREGFKAISMAPAEMADLLLVEPFANDPESLEAWLLACPDGAAVIAEAAEQGGGARAVYERCELGRLGLLGDSELGGVSLGRLVATHAVWAHLVDHDSEADIERRLLRLILGRQ